MSFNCVPGKGNGFDETLASLYYNLQNPHVKLIPDLRREKERHKEQVGAWGGAGACQCQGCGL